MKAREFHCALGVLPPPIALSAAVRLSLILKKAPTVWGARVGGQRSR